MPKSTHAVIDDLLKEMTKTVKSYPPTVKRIETKEELIDGTAFFPGGFGLWRGTTRHGPLPPNFPDRPVMFLFQAFEQSVYDAAKEWGGEPYTTFWTNLQRRYLDPLRLKGIGPEKCFFTNVYMGLRPGEGTDPMPGGPRFKKDCLDFLSCQIAIISPRIVVELGEHVQTALREFETNVPRVAVYSSSSRKGALVLAGEAKRIADAYRS